MSSYYRVNLQWPGKPTLGWPGEIDPSDLVIDEQHGDDPEPGNLLIAGDNLITMATLREQYAGKVDLVYIDPPFATGNNFYAQRDGQRRLAYRDRFDGGMAGYLSMIMIRMWALRELLSPEGKMFVHCDWRANSALRLVLDELFGAECFRNEIIWRRAPNLGRQAAAKQLGRVVDTIFVYSKTAGSKFSGKAPRRRAPVALDRKGKPKGAKWDDDRELYYTTAPRGDYTDDSIARLRKEGRVYDSSTGKVYIKYFLTRGQDGVWYKEQPVDTLWDDSAVRPLRHCPKSEAQGYDTQKPEGLLERIINWATQPGDLVFDAFGGSGTTAAVAHRLGRQFISCDLSTTSLAVQRRRLNEAGASFRLMRVRGYPSCPIHPSER